MTHHLFLDLLVKDPEDRNPVQNQALAYHLEGCAECREMLEAYRALEDVLGRAILVAPVPGFSERWITAYWHRQNLLQRKQAWFLLEVMFGILILLVSMLVFLAWPILRSPGVLISTWVYQIFIFWNYVKVLTLMAKPILNLSVFLIPLITWIFLAGLISELSVLWFVSFRILANPRRIIQ